MTLMYGSVDYKKKYLFQKVKFKMVAAIKFIFSFRFRVDTECEVLYVYIHRSRFFKYFIFPEILHHSKFSVCTN